MHADLLARSLTPCRTADPGDRKASNTSVTSPCLICSSLSCDAIARSTRGFSRCSHRSSCCTSAAVDSPERLGLDDMAELLAPLVHHPRAIGMELTIYDPKLDADGESATRLVELLERVLV